MSRHQFWAVSSTTVLRAALGEAQHGERMQIFLAFIITCPVILLSAAGPGPGAGEELMVTTVKILFQGKL